MNRHPTPLTAAGAAHRDRDELSARIDALLPRVQKPARYLGGEINAAHRAWESAQLHWLLILPDVYEIGMSHQGLRILYDLLNRQPETLAERAFAPWHDMEALLRAEQLPLFSLESRRPARAFDLLGFTLPYELLATNVLNLLDLAGIARLSAARDEAAPLIAGGGPCTGNPEPFAPYFDFFLIGDAEAALPAINATLIGHRTEPRRARLRALADLPGVYVPCFYEPRYAGSQCVALEPLDGVPPRVRRAYVSDLDAAAYPRQPIVPLIEAVQDRLTLEIQRGCTQGCRFCQAGIFYRPVRERSTTRLVDLAVAGLAATGWDEISLSSLSSADHSQIAGLARLLVDELGPAGTGISLSSLRVDTFSLELAGLVARVRKTGLTFAPEAGSQRLRNVINKQVTDEDLLQVVDAAYAHGWRRVKLYFMLGLPTETEADLDALIALVEELRRLGRRHPGQRTITVSLGSFVPKAQTPFQWEPFAGRDTLRERIAYVRERLRGRGVHVKSHDVDVSYVEALLSRGDRRVANLIDHVWRQGGRFEGWSEHFDVRRWEAALREQGCEAQTWTGGRDPQAPLPWDAIDLGVQRDWLLRERERAHAGETTADCRGGPCHQCGLGGPRDQQLAPPLDEQSRAALGQKLRRWFAPPVAEARQPGARLRCRLVYAKRDRLRFIAHLETGRLLLRLLRMARWPLVLTEGHNPHPKVAYGPPLPLGVEGLREVIDLHLAQRPSEEAWKRLQQLAPPGLSFIDWQLVDPQAPSLTAMISAADYGVTLPRDLATRARRERRLEAFRAADAVPVQKASKGRQRTVDLKRAILTVGWDAAPLASTEAAADSPTAAATPAAATEAAPAAPSGPPCSLHLRLRLQDPHGHQLGPLPALRALLALSEAELARVRIVREELLGD